MSTEQKYGTKITDVGVNAVFVATTEGVKVNIISLAAGDGGGAYYMPTVDMTELKNELWRGAIGSYKVNENSPNMITVRATIPMDVGGFTIRELALFSDEGAMIAIANTPDIEKVVMEDGIFGAIDVSLNIVLTNAGTLNFIVDSSTIMATAEDLENHNTDPNAHANLRGRTHVSATMPDDFQEGDTWWKIPQLESDYPDDDVMPDPEVPDVTPEPDPDPDPEPETKPEPEPEPDPESEPDSDSDINPEDNGKEVMQFDLVNEEMPLNVLVDGVLQGISNATENQTIQSPLSIFDILN